jgi:hypothetical protein
VERLLNLKDSWLRELPKKTDRRGAEVTVAVAVKVEESEDWINTRIAAPW